MGQENWVQPFKHYALEGFFYLAYGFVPALNNYDIDCTMALTLNRNSERIPRSLLQGNLQFYSLLIKTLCPMRYRRGYMVQYRLDCGQT
jgi:hypothetical protein